MPLFGKSDPDLQGWSLTQFCQAEPEEFDLWLGSRVVLGKEDGKRWSEIWPAEAERWLPVFQDAHNPIRFVMDAAAEGEDGTGRDFEKAAEATRQVTALIRKYTLPPAIKMGSGGPYVSYIDFPDPDHDFEKGPGETGEGFALINTLLIGLVRAIEGKMVRRCPVCGSAFVTAGKRRDAVYCSNRDGAIERNRRSRKKRQTKIDTV